MFIKSYYYFKRLLVVFLVMFASVFVLPFVLQQQVYGQVPSPQCLGVPCVTDSPVPSDMPTTSGNPDETSPDPSSSITPCTASTVSVTSTQRKSHHKLSKGSSGLFSSFLQFLIAFLNMLLQLIGGGTVPTPRSSQPVPDNGRIEPIPSNNPCPTSGETIPSISSEPSPSLAESSPSSVPSDTTSKSPSGQAMPSGNISGWKQIFADDFTTAVPIGAFSNCDNNTNSSQASCGGLKSYGSYYDNWWAYPNTWSDTAKSGADGNTGAPYGGIYHPEDTVSVSNGAMHIKMFRPSTGGDNHVATVVPRKCMSQQYGRYVERFKVVKADPGFKSAHLFYDNGFEVDYPENDYGQTISAYTHPGEANFDSRAKWTEWHTTAIEWTSGTLKFYMDGKLIGSSTNKVPNIKMSWVLQNESSITGPYAKNGATAQLDIDWVACYAPSS
jgi:hypothetical protein